MICWRRAIWQALSILNKSDAGLGSICPASELLIFKFQFIVYAALWRKALPVTTHRAFTVCRFKEMLLVNNVQSPEEMPGCCGSQPYFSIPSEEKLSKDRWEYLWHIGFRQTWTDKKMQLYFPFFCLPQWTFVQLELFFLQNLASAVQTTPSCSDMFMSFSQKVLTLPLWEILSRSFSMQPDLNKFTTLLVTRASLRSCGDWGKVVNFHLLQREMEER